MRTPRGTKNLQLVYAELRAGLGAGVAGGLLLQLTLLILETANEEDDDSASPIARKSRAVLFQPLDDAFSDGGWRVLLFEQQQGLQLSDDYNPQTISISERKTRLAGNVLWPRVTRLD